MNFNFFSWFFLCMFMNMLVCDPLSLESESIYAHDRIAWKLEEELKKKIEKILNHLFLLRSFRAYCSVCLSQPSGIWNQNTLYNFFKKNDIAEQFLSFLFKKSDAASYLSVKLANIHKEAESREDIENTLHDILVCSCVLYRVLCRSCACSYKKSSSSITEVINFFIEFSHLPLNELFDALEKCHGEFQKLIEQVIPLDNEKENEEQIGFMQNIKTLLNTRPWMAAGIAITTFYMWLKWKSTKMGRAIL